MSIGHTALGLLEAGPGHGDDLKRVSDARFAHLTADLRRPTPGVARLDGLRGTEVRA